jgi:hypothetical protein
MRLDNLAIQHPIDGQLEDGRIDRIVRPDTAGSIGGDYRVIDLECAFAARLCAGG